MVKRNLKPLLGLLIVLAGLPFMQTSAAQDPAGCEGMSAYREAMITTGQVYVDTLEEDGFLPGRDPLTYSSAEWEMLADNAAAWQKALKSIEPPAWAVDWHQTQIELAGLQEQLGIAAAGSGVVATLPFEESFSALQASADLGADEATRQCTTFWCLKLSGRPWVLAFQAIWALRAPMSQRKCLATWRPTTMNVASIQKIKLSTPNRHRLEASIILSGKPAVFTMYPWATSTRSTRSSTVWSG